MKPNQSITKFLLASSLLAPLLISSHCYGQVQDTDRRFVFTRANRTIVVEPYSSNIVRVTMSLDQASALAKPGYGFNAQPSGEGWRHNQGSGGDDVISSSDLVVRISPGNPPEPTVMPRNPIYQQILDKHWPPGKPWTDSNVGYDVVSVSTPKGKTLLTLYKWSMYKNDALAGDGITDAHKQLDPGYKVSATFDSPSGEHYYGLGEHQSSPLDLRDTEINCWPDYSARGGESVGVPFMISSRGYGLIWDNPSKTTVDLGDNQNNEWTSAVGERISFFVIVGGKADDIYEGYRHLTGVAHLLPKSAYGYIQSKCIYPTQQQLIEVAKGYRDRNLPLDVMVVDFLHESVEGNKDLDPTRWPDPASMNSQLHSMGIKTMISIWPHFATDSRYYNLLKTNGWFLQKPDGTPDQSWWGNDFGPDIDVTSPDAAKWFWSVIRDNYIEQDGFNYLWLDETEPDIDPANDFYSIGAGSRYYNLYPLFETGAMYDGFRRDFGDSRRAMILARATYLGAQSNGTFFWSSDIMDTWDTLRRSITAGLNFTASGMPYWCTDIGGYARRPVHADYQSFNKPLVSPAGAEDTVGDYSDYPELYVRWYEWAVFQPVMRAHGERANDEVWSFGKEATPILEKYLRLRYQLLPYTYSLAYETYQTGAPYMRALWMDFPNDENVSNISDEYMFGPAFLVAPVTVQGATARQVYLPAGSDWYNYWTNERLRGGQFVTVTAPIDTIPLFVRAGSIIPLGSTVMDADQSQKISSVRVYPGADADFTLYNDDGETYAYESGKDSITRLHWDEATHRLGQTGVKAWTNPDVAVVDVIKPLSGS